MDSIFGPRTVAVVGATEKEGSVGRTILWNLISSPFGGVVFPVNAKRTSVLGIKAYPDLASVPEKVDLAVVITPAPAIPGIIGQCVELGIPGAVIISAGFKEIGEEGARLEREILAMAQRGRMRIVGPNCLGVMSPVTGLNATFAAGMARPGKVGFISQSGALCTAILDWSFEQNVGFSHFVSVGSMIDVGWGDLIYYLGDDPRTESIVIYMESIGNARAFLSAAREVALTKPILVIKPGRTAQAAKAAASHTGSLTGSDEVLDAAFERSGVLRVDDIAELFAMAETLAMQPRPKGPRLTIVTNAGGPGVLATDALITSGGRLAEFTPATMAAFDAILPATWSRNNPVDIIGDATPERYAKALEVAAADPGSDGLLVVLTPQDMTDPTRIAEELRPLATGLGKPILASWMGGIHVKAGREVLQRAGIPNFEYPDEAARAFSNMWRFSDNLNALYQTPSLAGGPGGEAPPDRAAVADLVGRARERSRTILTEAESKAVLAAYGIPVIRSVVAATEAEAVEGARAIGYPVVLKIHSETITHKTDVGGVKLNLTDASEVRAAFNAIRNAVEAKAGTGHFLGVNVQPMVRLAGNELILGSSIDPQFGPVMLFGAGGSLVEVFRDRALALPPLTSTLARRMMERTRIHRALGGVRGAKPVDLDALAGLMVRFSQLVVENPRIREIDINPLLASAENLLALDARVVLHDPAVPDAALPRPAIRPYPWQYAGEWKARDGSLLRIRPIRPEDEPRVARYHETLSARTVYLRYLQEVKLSQRIAHDRLRRICFNDYDREIALVAESADPGEGAAPVVGIGRLTRLRWTPEGRIALMVTDLFQGQGLGSEILRRLLAVAKSEGLERILMEVAPDNLPVMKMLERAGFRFEEKADRKLLHAELALK
ncbi:MAG: bifunctional acetate--CoA ligase family protein/GNAT family N-acetyltransferase [Planctomycetaceae bacterium]|nr:bifunctional acetate--CoA ligase family protein/GNAT family N-acetyltransferase [Planctomycetota bacterium]NUN51581.1 bifunctional acetate--CoA ligase family protein/GNAT family N-acetyltransferase [Planctomycetaceae bacterium]